MKSDPLPCPGIQTVQENLKRLPASLAALLYSVVDMADGRSAKRLEVYLDERKLPCQSLLNPLLGDCQGAALCFNIPGEQYANSLGPGSSIITEQERHKAR